MQKKLFVLLGLLLASTIIVMSTGAYLRMTYLDEAGLFQEKSLIEIPFVVMKDPVARFAIGHGGTNATEQETEASEETQSQVVIRRRSYASFAPLPEFSYPTQPPYVEITENWFDDVLFIGDSRTVGLRDYARLGEADYFCSIGMSVFDARELVLSDLAFEACNLETLLRTKRYHKVYICLGLNEAGAPYDLLMEGYGELVEMVRETQPDATIILHGLITVSREKAASEWYFSLDNIQKINRGIQNFADGNRIRYIDANGYYADEEGYMPEGLTHDGCHFDKEGYRGWANWIFENAKTLDVSFG